MSLGAYGAQARGGQDLGVLLKRSGVGDTGDACAEPGELGWEPGGADGDVGDAEQAAGFTTRPYGSKTVQAVEGESSS